MDDIIVTSGIVEKNPYRSTNSDPTIYKLTITSEGTQRDMEFIRDRMLKMGNECQDKELKYVG